MSTSKLCFSKRLATIVAGGLVVVVIALLFSFYTSSSSLRSTNSRAMFLYDETACDFTKPPQGTYKQNCGACKADGSCKSPLIPYTHSANSLCYCVTELPGGATPVPTVPAGQPTVVVQPTVSSANDAWGLLSVCGTQERMGNCNDGLFCTLGNSALELSPEQQQCVTYEAGGNNISGKITVIFAGKTEDINLNNGVNAISSPVRTYSLPFPQDVTIVPQLYAWWKATFFSCDGGTTFRFFEGATFHGCLNDADETVKTKEIVVLAKILSKREYYEKFKADNSIKILVKTYKKADVDKMIGTKPDFSSAISLAYTAKYPFEKACKLTWQDCVADQEYCDFTPRNDAYPAWGKCMTINAAALPGTSQRPCRDYSNTQCDVGLMCRESNKCVDDISVVFHALNPQATLETSRAMSITHSNNTPQSSIQKIDFHKTSEWGKGKGKLPFQLLTYIQGIPYRPYSYLFKYNCGRKGDKDKTAFSFHSYSMYGIEQQLAGYEDTGWVLQVPHMLEPEVCDYSDSLAGVYTITGKIYIVESGSKAQVKKSVLEKTTPFEIKVNINLIDP